LGIIKILLFDAAVAVGAENDQALKEATNNNEQRV
jgi:hypothetical protein